MPLTGSLMFVYTCIDVGDLVEGRVGMSPLNGIPTPPLYWIANINTYRQTIVYLSMASQPSPLLDR
jgi:hypothetical protein